MTWFKFLFRNWLTRSYEDSANMGFNGCQISLRWTKQKRFIGCRVRVKLPLVPELCYGSGKGY